MIKVETILKVADNCGATVVKCIKLLKLSQRVGAIPGQQILIVVQKNIFKKHVIKKSKIIIKGKICNALVLRTAKNLKRWGNFFVKGSYNCITLLNEYNLPFATRIFGPIVREIRFKSKYTKIVGLSLFTF